MKSFILRSTGILVLILAFRATAAGQSLHSTASDPLPSPLVTRSESQLIAALDHPADQKTVADACRELVVVGTPKTIPTLVRLLNDDRFAESARYALENISEPGVNAALRKQLASSNGKTLVGIIHSLGVRRDEQAVKSFSDFLKGSDATVADAAARALGRIATPESTTALQSSFSGASAPLKAAIFEGLTRQAEKLSKADKSGAGISIYQQLLAQSDLPLLFRASATHGLILALGSKGMPKLETALLSQDYEIFAAGIRAALETRALKSTRIICNALPKFDNDRQVVALKALGELRDSTSVKMLLTRMNAGDKTTRLTAIEAATATEDSSVVTALVNLLANSDQEISAAARDGLAALTNPKANAAVMKLIGNSSPQMRVKGIELAGRRRMTSAIPALIKAANDPASEVRVAAFKRLGELGGAAELKPLLALILANSSSKELQVAGQAVSAICNRETQPTASNPAIISAYNQASAPQKAALLEALGSIGGRDALETVRAALANKDRQVHGAALTALSDWPDSSSVQTLIEFVPKASDADERQEAFNGLVKLTRESSLSNEEKLTLLNRAGGLASSRREKQVVIAGLGDIQTVEAVRSLSPYLTQEGLGDDAGASVVRSAARVNPSSAIEVIPVLQTVMKVASAEQTISKARNRLKQLGHPVEDDSTSVEPGFKSLFNGKDLTGWAGRSNHWSVQDGAITGITTAENPAKGNNFLIAQDGATNLIVGDFELRLSYRFSSEWGNSGVQYRSKDMGNFVVHGYQGDMETGTSYSGILYEEGGRGIVAKRGEKVFVRAKPNEPAKHQIEVTGSVGDSNEIQAGIKQGGWNDYVIIAKGNHLQHFINGKQTVDVTDEHTAKAASSGILALQLHAGPPMKIQFKNIRIKFNP